MSQKEIKTCSTTDMWTYASSEISNSLISNTIFGFAMIFYTDALGLSPALAGIAMAVAIFWDAITDPLMGHISDNTKSRFGRRHQYMLFGGIAMVIAFFFIWAVPLTFRQSSTSLFWYLVIVNMLMRTAYTVFIIPTTALGFEMCQEYTGRTKIQGIKAIFNMIANFLGPGLAWALFVPDVKDPSNYIRMATVFSVVSLLSIFFLVFITRKYIVDSREMKTTGSSPSAFFKDVFEIITDPKAICVFAFAIVVVLGIALVAGLQMYVYEHFMHLDGIQKTITHSATMVGMMTGAAFCSRFAARFDKKGAVYVGGAITLLSGLVLTVLFVRGTLTPGQFVTLPVGISDMYNSALMSFDVESGGPLLRFTHKFVAILPEIFFISPDASGALQYHYPMVAFAFFGATYWFGNGVLMPVATSMMADISEINELKTGVNKDGSYSAMYSLSMKIAQSLSALIVGFALTYVGFVTLGDIVGNKDYAIGVLEGTETTLSSNTVLAVVNTAVAVEDSRAEWGFVKGTGSTIQTEDTLDGFMPHIGTVQSNDAIKAYLTMDDMVLGTNTLVAALAPIETSPNSVLGYVKGARINQNHDTVMRLFIATYIVGPVISITSLILIWLYPVNRKILEKLRADAA